MGRAEKLLEKGAGNEALQELKPYFDPKTDPYEGVHRLYVKALLARANESSLGKNFDGARKDIAEALTLCEPDSSSFTLAKQTEKTVQGREAEVLFERAEFMQAAKSFVAADMFDRAVASYVKAGDIPEAAKVATKLPKPYTPEIRKLFLAAARLSILAGNSTVADYQFAEAGRPEEAVEILLETNHATEAYLRAEAMQRVDLIAKTAEAAGYHDVAVKSYLELNQIDAAVKILVAAENFSKAGRVLAEKGRIEEAAATFEEGKLWTEASVLWLQAKRPDRIEQIVKNSLQARDVATAGGITLLIPDRSERRALVARLLEGDVKDIGDFEKASFLANVQEWDDAAPAYEKAGYTEAAAAAWELAEDKAKGVEGLIRNAKANNDPHLMLLAIRAAKVYGTQQQWKPLLESAKARAVEKEDVSAIADLYAEADQSVDGAILLLDLIEKKASDPLFDRVDILQKAGELLPKKAIGSVGKIIERFNSLSRELVKRLDEIPTVYRPGSRLTNHYDGSDRQFDYTTAELIIRNGGNQSYAKVTFVIECFEKAPELYRGIITAPPAKTEEDKLRAKPEWLWSDRNFAEKQKDSPVEFRFEFDVDNLDATERRHLRLDLKNRIPYRYWKVRILRADPK